MAACIAVACGPLALALVTEGRPAPAGARLAFLAAVGLALAAGAAVTLGRVEARRARAAETRERSLREAGDQQAATAEVLRAMAASPPDLHGVLDAIARNAARACDGLFAAVFRVDGALIRLAAHHGLSPAGLDALQRRLPRSADDEGATGRALRSGAVVHYPDIPTDPGVPASSREVARAQGYRSLVCVPMLHPDGALGTIEVSRPEGGFAERQIALLRTFADQAVIAIENVRLFGELESRNRELTEALEQQTATSEILRAISASPTDTQPVFKTIARSAVRLCDAVYCAVFQVSGERIDLVAHHNIPPEGVQELRRLYPAPLGAATRAARAARERTTIQISDVQSDPTVTEFGRQLARMVGYRSQAFVPMLRGERTLGVITLSRREAGTFPAQHLALLQTFADQAVIAIENVRLVRELQARTRELARSVEELQALGEVGRAVSSTLDLPTVLATIVARAVQLSGASGGVVYEYDEAGQAFQLRASHRTEDELVEVLRATPIRLGEGATGQAALRGVPVEVADIGEDREYQIERVRALLLQLGYRSILGIPLMLERRILGALTVWRRESGSFPPEVRSLLQTFASQSTIAIQNARLFREIEAKGRELEVASRHKSQFLANMSHELRTPLNAILGYTELLVDGIYGDLSPKVADVMGRIDGSGKHLLGLINDVLDLSKIEAGQLQLALAEYSLRDVVHAVVTQLGSLAAEKGLILTAHVAPDLPAGRGDDRRLAQVLLNLVGNAVKFTEVGTVRIVAHPDGDAFVVSVADTGPGIADADRQRIFEEFQQADSSSTRRKGGTGLGLSIARRIVELHGGRLWVESTVGRGSTFIFRIPARVERQAART